MTHETFTIVFYGEALQDHTMDVRDLAPALLSLSQLFDETSRLLYGDKVDVRLHVKAVEAGCFSVDIGLAQSLFSQFTDLFNSDEVNAALNLKEIIIGSGVAYGLFRLIKRLKGQPAPKVTDLENGAVRIETDGESFDVPKDLLRAYNETSIRKAIEKVTAPLDKEGIDQIVIRSGKDVIETIYKENKEYFSLPVIEGEEEILRNTRKGAFSIESLTFKEKNKWRLNDGGNTVSVTIADLDFLQKVKNNQVSFSKSDILICEIEDIWTMQGGKLSSEHNVVKVLEYRPVMQQTLLQIEEAPDEDNVD